MATLTNTQISVTYVGLLKTSANTVLTSTAQQITDGDGNNSILFLSTAGVGIGGSPASGKELDVTGNVQVTGDLIIDNITIDGSTITNDTGDLTIVNTADNGNIIFQTDDASGGVETYFFLDGANTSGNPITLFPDNSRAAFGAAEDLSIYHDPSIGSVIEEAGAGDLFIDTNQAIKFRKTGTSELMAKMTPDDAVELYHDGDIKFATLNSGVNVQSTSQATLTITHLPSSADFAIRVDSNGKAKLSYSSGGFELDNQANAVFSFDSPGNATFVENVSLADSKKLKIGTGEDLQIYHDGSNSYIQDTGTGGLRITSDVLRILDTTNAEVMIKAEANAAVELYHDNSKKFETTAGGVSITGTIDSTGTISVTGASSNIKVGTDTGKIMAGASNDLQIYHDGSDSYIDHVGTGNLNIRNTTDDKDIIFQSDDGSGGTTEYFRLDGGNTNMVASKTILYNDSVKASFGNSEDLKIKHDGTNSSIENVTGDLTIQNGADDKDIIFQCDNGSGGLAEYFRLDGSAVRNVFLKETLYADNVKARFGSGGDLEIVHDGTNSILSNQTGEFFIEQQATDNDLTFTCDDGTGNTTPYITLDGSATLTKFFKNTKHTDSVKATFGDSADLQIYHDGSDSYIQDTGTGILAILGSEIRIQNSVGNENIAKFIPNGAVELYHDNSKKFETTSTGATVTGNLGIGVSSPSQILHLEKADDPMLLITRGSSNRVLLGDTGSNNGGDLLLYNSSGSNTVLIRSGDDSYLNGGNVGIGVTSPTSPLTIKSNSASSGSSGISIQANGSTDDIIRLAEKSGNGGRFHMFDGGVEKIAFYTDGTDNHILAGRLGLGTSSPGGNLHVVGASGGAGEIYLSDADNGTGTGDALLISKSGTNTFIYNRDSGEMNIGTNDDSDVININSSGAIKFSTYGAGTLVTDSSGNITASSDSSLKTEVNEKISGLDEILQLQPRAYYWNKDKNKNVEFGFFADEVKDAIPEAAPKHKNGTYGLLDRGIIAALVNSIQELQQEIEILKSK